MVRRKGDDAELYSRSWRKWAALLAVSTLAWEFYRDEATFTSMSLWSLMLQFIYFQLPLKSRAVPYFHSISFIGAFCVPVMYFYLLYWKPQLEHDHMELWGMGWQAVVVRSFLINFAPLVFHVLELRSHSKSLVVGYSTRPIRLMMIFPVVALVTLFVALEFSFPSTEDTEDMEGISEDDFFFTNKLVSSAMLIVAYTALYSTVLQKAYFAHDRETDALREEQNHDQTAKGKDS